MRRKILPLVLLLLSALFATAQRAPTQLKPEWQKLLLELSSNYFTAVKEAQVDLDSSLIYVSGQLGLSRLELATEGLHGQQVINAHQWFDARDVAAGKQALSSLKGKELATQFALIGAYYAFEPGQNKDANSMALQYLHQAFNMGASLHDMELTLAAKRLIGKVLLKQGGFQAADSVFNEVQAAYAQRKDVAGQARTLHWWGLYTPVTMTSTPGRLNNIRQAIGRFEQSNNQPEKINALVNESYLLALSRKLDSAEIVALQADSIARRIQFPYWHYIDAALASFSLFAGKFGEPLNYGIQAVHNAEVMRDSIGLPYMSANIGALYNTDGRFSLAQEWNLKASDYFLRRKEASYAVLLNIVNAYLVQRQDGYALAAIQRTYNVAPPVLPVDQLFYNLACADYYGSDRVGKWNRSAMYMKTVDSIEATLEQTGITTRKAAVALMNGELYARQRQFAKARPYLEQYVQMSSGHTEGVPSLLAVLERLLEIDSLAGDKQHLLEDYERYATLLQKNFTMSKARMAEEMQAKYASEKKESEIKMLTQAAELERLNYSRANQAKNITIAGIVLLVLIALLLYRQMRLKQKSNTVITQKNALLQTLVEEKEWLLKEIHHRVKNNLHTVICLLESQAAYLSNDALTAIEASQHRIYAMSLIHQKLYQSDDVKVIDMPVYLAEFVQYLTDSFGAPAHIQVQLEVADMKLGPGQAIPVGLIINEAVNNAFKYAFPNGRRGRISIRLWEADGYVQLRVADDGIGLHRDENQEANSLGLELIQGLGKDLRGNITFEVDHGTCIALSFLKDPMEASKEKDAAVRN